MQEKDQDGAQPGEAMRRLGFPDKETKLFATPDGRIKSWWNEGRLLYAEFVPDVDSERQEAGAAGRPAPTYYPYLCNWKQLDTVDGDKLWKAISNAHRKKLRDAKNIDDAMSMYEYLSQTKQASFVNGNDERDSFPTYSDKAYTQYWIELESVDDKTYINRIKRKDPITVMIALAYLRIPLHKLRDKDGNKLNFEELPTGEESTEAAKELIAERLDRICAEGYYEPANTVYMFLTIVENAAAMLPKNGIGQEVVQTIVDAADANIRAWDTAVYLLCKQVREGAADGAN
jgi:hypothetical protein